MFRTLLFVARRHSSTSAKVRKIDELPIGHQDVRSVIESGYYVDKTEYAQKLIEEGHPIFIARPRRFGKSLFIDTLATICSQEQEVFKNYHIGKPENGYEWKKYPVMKLDNSSLMYNTPEILQQSLEDSLIRIASIYQLKLTGRLLTSKLCNLVEDMTKLGNDYESKIVLLIDEYDAPIVHLTKGSDLEQANMEVMKYFFSAVKSLSQYFQLTFITGVSNFSIWDGCHGANHLKDITIHASADAMFGFTHEEIIRTFSKKLEHIAKKWSTKENKKITPSEVMEQIATYYNGYRFYENSLRIYNPWSTLGFLDSGKLENYWYESGSPSLMIDKFLAHPDRFDFNIDDLEIAATREDLLYTDSLKSLMFQTGYLTIHNYDRSTGLYILKFPNKEIEKSFQRSIKSRIEKSVKDYDIIRVTSERQFLGKILKC